MVRLPYIIWVVPNAITCLFMRQVEGDLMLTWEEKVVVIREAEIAVMWSQAKACQQPVEAWTGKEQIPL